MRAAASTTLLASALLASCAAEEAPVEPSDTTASEEAGKNPNVPAEYANTAWRVLAEDGARYVTYLDSDGSYRDLRNGDPFQTGSWALADGAKGGQICFNPDAENARESCWQPERMQEGRLFVRGPQDRRIELNRVDYVPPQEDAEADDAAAE